MAETANISKIAEILALELFSRFLWFETGGWNQNWACVREDHVTSKRKRKKHAQSEVGTALAAATSNAPHLDDSVEVKKILTHPSDVVFYYDEPYGRSRTYINTDLKSYKKGSITSGSMTEAIQSLALALECAEVSDEWKAKYVHDAKDYEIIGLLFIYNHDGEYDTGFEDLLAKVNIERLKIPRNSRIFVLGPRDIRWLDNVRLDLTQLRGSEFLPKESKCAFYYPDLVRRKKVQLSAKAATLEMLTGPWVILAHQSDEKNPEGYVVYFRGRGKNAEEFLYLLDHLMHYQMVQEGVRICVRVLDADENAPAHFKRAVDEYIENLDGGDSELAALLKTITFELIPQVKSQFSLVKIGMTRG